MTIIGLHILGLDISEFNSPAYYNNMIIVSKFSTAFSGLFIILTIFLVTPVISSMRITKQNLTSLLCNFTVKVTFKLVEYFYTLYL
jgi:hypothetical protein